MTFKQAMALTMGLTVLSNAYGFSGWDQNNAPYLMGNKYNHSFSQLPKSGVLSKTPWTGDYWPTWKGGITLRWKLGGEKKAHYDYNQPGQGVSAEELSPAEKYDLYLGRKDFPITKSERQRTGVLTRKDIPKWEGLCHAWAPATVNYEHPKTVTLKSKEGKNITFYASDIKALLTLKVHYDRNAKTYFLGTRCNIDNKKDPNAVLNNSECKDTNAGAFHIALANQIGLMNESFIVDKTRDLEVWNQAVFKYSSKVLSQREPSPTAHRNAVKEYVVKTKMYYISEEAPTTESYDVAYYNGYGAYGYKVEEYEYTLELDSQGKIVGGEWISWNRPDFIWKQDRVSFSGIFKDLETIYNASIAKQSGNDNTDSGSNTDSDNNTDTDSDNGNSDRTDTNNDGSDNSDSTGSDNSGNTDATDSNDTDANVATDDGDHDVDNSSPRAIVKKTLALTQRIPVLSTKLSRELKRELRGLGRSGRRLKRLYRSSAELLRQVSANSRRLERQIKAKRYRRAKRVSRVILNKIQEVSGLVSRIDRNGRTGRQIRALENLTRRLTKLVRNL